MRRAAILAAGGTATLVLIAVAAWTILPWALETLGARWIGASLGIPTPRFSVAALSPTRLELRDLTIGQRTDESGGGGSAIAAGSVVVTFDLPGRRLKTLVIEGARADAEWRDGALVVGDLGPLDALLAGGGGNDQAIPTLPVEMLRLSGARLLLRSPLGLLDVVVDATATQEDKGHLRAEGALSATAPGLTGEAVFALNGNPDQPTPWLGIGGNAQIDLTANDGTIPGLAHEIDGYASFSVVATPEGIRISSADGLAITADGIAPAARNLLPEALKDSADGRLTVVVGGRADAPLSVLVAPRAEGGLGITASATASVRLGAMTGRITSDGSVSLDADGTIAALDLPQVDMVANGLPALGGLAHASILGRHVMGRPGELSLDLDAYMLGEDIAWNDASVPRLRLHTSGSLTWSEGLVRFGLAEGRASVDGPASLPGATLPEGMAWTVTAPDGDAVTLDLRQDSPVLTTRLTLPTPSLRLHAGGRTVDSRFESAAIEAALPLAEDALADQSRSVTVTLEGGEIHSGEVQASAIHATLRQTADGLSVEADAQADLLPGEVAPLPKDIQAHRPLRLHLSAHRGPDAPVTFSARVREGGLQTILTAEGRHDLDSGKGSAAVQVPRLSFGDALQPGHLYAPLAAAALRVDGDAAAHGTVSWAGTTLHPRLEVLLDGVTVQRGFVVLRQMHGIATLTRFWPPRTPPKQILAIAAIDAGIPLGNAEMTYHLDGKGYAVVDDARMTLAGGTIHADPFTLSLQGQGSARTVLHMAGVRLDPLVDLADLGGLTATGTLDGEVPVELRQGNVLFHDGILRSQGPGSIRYRPLETPAALSAGGGGVELMLQALDDFQYQSLRLSLVINGIQLISRLIRLLRPQSTLPGPHSMSCETPF